MNMSQSQFFLRHPLSHNLFSGAQRSHSGRTKNGARAKRWKEGGGGEERREGLPANPSILKNAHWFSRLSSFTDWQLCHGAKIMYRSIPKPPIPPPPGQTPGHLTFLKSFGQIPRYVASLDGQMPHPLELQRGSNPPPSRHVTHEISEYKQNRLPFGS